MAITGSTVPSNSVEHLHTVLASIQQNIVQPAEAGNTTKHQLIRITHWVRKLRSQPTSNPTWLKSVLEYANVLLEMLLEGVVGEPFTKMPPQGPLAALPRYQVARLAKVAAKFGRVSAARSRAAPMAVRLKSARQKATHDNNAEEESCRAVAVAQTVNKQIQTQEDDEQWEWQRVWKGAFDKMRQQLQQKTEETDVLTTENKELRALIAGSTKALEEAERTQRDAEAKHLAELDNLRAVHALELSDLRARHRQKLQQVTLQNDEKLLRRRRASRFVQPSASDTTPDADFLQYIDDFYSATLHLTEQNKV